MYQRSIFNISALYSNIWLKEEASGAAVKWILVLLQTCLNKAELRYAFR